jgi:mRNA interferase MazF
MGMVIRQYDIYLIDLDPSVGHEIQKTKPCVVISPDEMNRNIDTVIIAPMTTRAGIRAG